MTDLVAFLLARLDEDQAIALGVSIGPRKPELWIAKLWPFGKAPRNWAVDCPFGAVVVDGAFEASAAHIARHNPARVLAEIAAKRAIIDAHPNVNDGDCGTCVRAGWGYPTHGGSTIEHWPCPTLRLLAAPFADHEDFDPAWSTT